MDCPTNNIVIPSPLIEPCGNNYISTSCVISANSNTSLDLPAGSSQEVINEALTTALLYKEQQIQELIARILILENPSPIL